MKSFNYKKRELKEIMGAVALKPNKDFFETHLCRTRTPGSAARTSKTRPGHTSGTEIYQEQPSKTCKTYQLVFAAKKIVKELLMM